MNAVNLEVRNLSEEDRRAILVDWEPDLSDEDHFWAEGTFLANNHEWYKISDHEGTLLAVYELRNVRDTYVKHMDIRFSPKLRWMEGWEPEIIQQWVDKTIDVIYSILNQALIAARATRQRKLKIYVADTTLHMVYSALGRAIKEYHPDDLRVKFYSKWIEIDIVD